MNDFTDKDEQTFLNACAAGGNDGSAKPGWSTKAFKGDIGSSVRLEPTQT
jgi:hypothetical protein